MSHTASNLVLHLIFSTKGRQPLITPEIRPDLFAYLGGIVREMRGTALIVNGTADHVHMLIRIRPVQSAAEIARVVKTNSSRWVHQKWNMQFAWQTGYGAFSVSESNVPTVFRYIATQEQHHKKSYPRLAPWAAFSRRLAAAPLCRPTGVKFESALISQLLSKGSPHGHRRTPHPPARILPSRPIHQ